MTSLSLEVASRRFDSTLLASERQRLNRALIVGPAALVDVRLRAVSLEVSNRSHRSVNRKLLVVGAETMTVGVRIREETGLQNGICGRLDVRNEVRGREGSLLDFREVVLRVLVENEFPDRSKREFGMGPHFRQVENIVSEVLSLLRCHGLLVMG